MNKCNHIIGIHWNYDCTTLVEDSIAIHLPEEEKAYMDFFNFCPLCGAKLEVPNADSN